MSLNTPFVGVLGTNENYLGLYNMIISQMVFDVDVAEPTLANILSQNSSFFGDRALYYSADVMGSWVFGGDAEAQNLLQLYRNQNVHIDEIVINSARQTAVTIDRFLTKRAWQTEDAFVQFTSIMSNMIYTTKRIYDNGYVNSWVGTNVSTAPRANQVVDMTDMAFPTTNVERQAYDQVRGQRISLIQANIATELQDNRRDYNELGYMRAYRPDELLVVWSAQRFNEVLNLSLPNIYHEGMVRPISHVMVPAEYFGTPNASATQGSADGSIRSLVEQTIEPGGSGAGTAVHVFPGEAIPATNSAGGTITAPAGTSYTVDNSILFKMISSLGVPYKSQFEVTTNFENARSLTNTFYLTWNYNTLVALGEKPFVTVRILEPTAS